VSVKCPREAGAAGAASSGVEHDALRRDDAKQAQIGRQAVHVLAVAHETVLENAGFVFVQQIAGLISKIVKPFGLRTSAQ
jgi:hypothetical protein